jgi:preprotein translocase subunit SecA
VLVGTASVAKSEVLSRLLEIRGIPHNVLNAKQHAREAQIVAQAGRLHAITVATNMAGRGVDILLGGNPDGLATQEVFAQGLELDSDEGRAAWADLRAKFETQCKAEGDKVRELGGLYVLGSERHESRRIDNQLRGRSGRQGDPGESRFFLSLEDELMRLFATGAMNWVMGRALPEDVPIEAKMVTRAIERAQNTVEARNAEIRKDVLKYDEVMNEQRKVIYARRMQVLDGEDLREHTEELLDEAIDSVVTATAEGYAEDWDLGTLVSEVSQYYPTKFTVDDLRPAETSDQLYESIRAEATEYYADRENSIPGGPDMARELEREIMLQIIDQRWREHLAEMDYLREGINLRAMGQQDPLVAWQREGFNMFGQLMDATEDDYLRYVLHVEVLTEPAPEPDLGQASYQAADDPVQGPASIALAAQQEQLAQMAQEQAHASLAQLPDPAATGADEAASGGAMPDGFATQAPTVKSERDKIGRNDPCWCGSNKKYKLCHGR